jgi:hypothetical protein
VWLDWLEGDPASQHVELGITTKRCDELVKEVRRVPTIVIGEADDAIFVQHGALLRCVKEPVASLGK